ncbi:hypothetical protein [Tautonia rosea]|uniref:hypothetical protein n=1 Tax=Tautonia rosea TaxID=2728037 RepID=UPI0014759D8F|nr:hypothetical protein [Tautonia rosea]
MISVNEFRERCRQDSPEDIVDEILLTEESTHVSKENKHYIIEQLSSAFAVPAPSVQVWITGSAKLGFSLVEKTRKDRNGIHEVLSRYRSFGPDSDIDIAVVSPEIFRMIWDDLSIFAHGYAWMPWDSKRLGDYMVYGWLRPDHFPRGSRLRRCDDWWDCFRYFSADLRFGRRKVRGGLFHSLSDLKRYLRRAVKECINFERENS